MYISYSGDKTHSDCPASYLFGYILKIKPPEPDNRVNMLFGDTVGKVFEKFYANRIWKASDTKGALEALVGPTLQSIIHTETQRGGVFDWEDPKLAKNGPHSLEQVRQEVIDTIPRGLRSIKQHRLIGPDVQAEMKLDYLLEGHKIGGRADFVMTRIAPHNDLVIIDGKGSKYRGQYTNVRQLRWYALQYRARFGVTPERLAFLYWREEPEESMDWYDVLDAELDALQSRILLRVTDITKAQTELEQLSLEERTTKKGLALFPPQPGGECRFCRFQSICEAGKAHLSGAHKQQMKQDMDAGVEDGGFSF